MICLGHYSHRSGSPAYAGTMKILGLLLLGPGFEIEMEALKVVAIHMGITSIAQSLHNMLPHSGDSI